MCAPPAARPRAARAPARRPLSGIARAQAGREGREKFGSKKGLKERGSLTNREKSKKKNFGMMRYKKEVRMKQFRSMRDKQVAAHQAVVKQKKQIK